MDIFIGAFCQNRQRIRGALEDVPFLGALGDGEGIVLVARTAEHDPKTKIARLGSFGRSGKCLDLDGDIAEIFLFRLEDRCLVIGAGDLNVIKLRLMIADKVIIEFRFRPAGGRVGKIIMIQHVAINHLCRDRVLPRRPQLWVKWSSGWVPGRASRWMPRCAWVVAGCGCLRILKGSGSKLTLVQSN